MRNYETRHIFMALSFVVLFLSPILVLVLPSFVANGLYYTSENWYVFVPGTSYIVYSVGFLFLFLALFVLFLLSGRRILFVISPLCMLLSGVSFYIAAQSYTSLAYDSISYREIFTKDQHTYAWDEIEKAVYIEVPRQGDFPEYEFYFNDGEKLVVVENGVAASFKGFIQSGLSNAGIQMEVVRGYSD